MKICGPFIFIASIVAVSFMFSTEATAIRQRRMVDRIECERDQDCADGKICHYQECHRTCIVLNSYIEPKLCGENASCYPIFQHDAMCLCDEFYEGDPRKGCQRINQDIAS